MRHVLLFLTAGTLLGCDGAADPVDSSTQSFSGPSLAATDKSVDPGSLTPAPAPPIEADCKADGRWIICHTTLDIENVNIADGDFGCGTVYETSRDVRYGIRWYDAADSVIVKRHVTQDVRGTLSLSPDGGGPTATITAHDNWDDSDYADPNDLESGVSSYHGDDLAVTAPGFGVIVHFAGHDTPEGIHHGVFLPPEDPAVAEELCAALTR